MFVADRFNNRIRKVDANGIITTVAGTGAGGFSGDGGPATNAQLTFPCCVALDGQGNLLITDTSNHRIRKVDASGIITTVAGSATAGFSGDGGPATSAQLNAPFGVVRDGQGNLFVADSLNNRIRRVDTNGIITTVTGTGTEGDSGDGGPAASAQLDFPMDLVLDGQGNLFVADTESHRIRKIQAGSTGSVILTLINP